MKVAFADHIMQIPLGYHLTLGSGKMRKIMDENIESVEKFIAHQLPDFVASLVAPLVLVIILLGIDWRYGVVVWSVLFWPLSCSLRDFNGEAKEKMHVSDRPGEHEQRFCGICTWYVGDQSI